MMTCSVALEGKAWCSSALIFCSANHILPSGVSIRLLSHRICFTHPWMGNHLYSHLRGPQSPISSFVQGSAAVIVCVLKPFSWLHDHFHWCNGKPSLFLHGERFLWIWHAVGGFCQHGWWMLLCNLWICNALDTWKEPLSHCRHC